MASPPPSASTSKWAIRDRFAAATLRARLSSFFVLAVILLVLVISLSIISFVRLVDARHTVLDLIDPANLQADQLLVAYLNQETGVRGYVLSGDALFLQPYQQGLGQESLNTGLLNHSLAGNRRLLTLAQQAEAQAATWQDEYAKRAIAAVGAQNHKFASKEALLQSKSLFDAVRVRFATLDAALASSRASAEEGLSSATAFLIGTLAGALLLIVATALLLSRALRQWVTDPLVAVGLDSLAVAEGDIEHRIAPSGPPDFRRLAAAVDAMRERIVFQLREAEAASGHLALLNTELSQSNVELEQFAYVASHDLQEPLRKVTSFVQLLQQRYEGQLDARADQYIDFAVDGAKRMQVLINDLLAFSRVGRTTERFVEVDLASCVSLALANLRILIEETGAQVDIGPLPVIRGDPGLLGSLWQNVIGNAIKFRSEERPEVGIDSVRQGEEWLCCVTDNGIGIDPRFADKIFVLFQRLHSREAYEGTGIGLALSKKIVEFHGGRIWLDEAHHPGTRVCFTFPVPDGEETVDHR